MADATVSATIRDVARRAGVSVATVSRVLNHSGQVRDDTRARVESAAAELRYTPNSTARSLITRRTATFGVVLPDLFGEFFSEVIRGMDPLARSRGYHLLLSSSHDDHCEIEFALAAMRGRVDGLVVMSPHVGVRSLAACLPPELPVVLLNCDAAGADYPAIGIDNHAGALAMVRHLVSLGHTRIGMIRGGQDNFDARERRRGYHAALDEAGLPGADGRWEAPGDFTEAGGWDAALRLARLPEPPTAVFCANDSMAVGAMSALRGQGLRVPEDVAVAGFDDIPMARYLSPPLTSVHVDVHRLGARAVEMLCDALADPRAPPRQELVPTRLVIRRSCGAGETVQEPRFPVPA
ncbi:MAG TPA: LacI family DNA-binding transcriptional regulator [Longimicrobium sp.]|nr:LacI family DNA-binding transcriptional regulator [Longimicrobium sp.]